MFFILLKAQRRFFCLVVEQLKDFAASVGHRGSNMHRSVTNLGVMIDSSFNFDKQISSVVLFWFCVFQLSLLAKVNFCLSYEDWKSRNTLMTRLD